MFDVLRFWIARGVDGFRVDAMRQVLKDLSLRDNPATPGWEGPPDVYDALQPRFTTDLDELQEVVAAIRAEIGDERLFMAEVTAPIERLVRYYGSSGEGAHLPFNFHLIFADWDAAAVADLVERYEAALPEGAWPNWVLGNHDRPRIASRVGPGQARAAAMLLLTLRGTPTLYYGDEIGMEDVPVPAARVVDPDGRDPERSPMRWTGSPGAGFSDAEPWLPLGDLAVNVEAQEADPRSMLALHRALIALRRSRDDLVAGGYETLIASDVLAYRRGDCTIVALNLTAGPRTADLAGEILLDTGLTRAGERVVRLELAPGEGVILAR
jgi:alpha-glucosidase